MKKTKKPGRPKLPKKARLKPLQIRISDEQRALAEKAAKSKRQPLSTWARETLLNEAERVIGES